MSNIYRLQTLHLWSSNNNTFLLFMVLFLSWKCRHYVHWNVSTFLTHHTPSHPRRHSTVSTSNLTTYSSTPKSASYCQHFSIIDKMPGCCHVAACCRHSARNNTAMLPHPAACNLITPLLCSSSRNAKPFAKSQVETSVRAVVALFHSFLSPPPLPTHLGQ